MKASFPLDDGSDTTGGRDVEAEADMSLVIGVITGIRNIRGEMNIPPSAPLTVSIQSQDEHTRNTIDQCRNLISNLARLETLTVDSPGFRPKTAATSIFEDATIFVSLEGHVDFSQESKRLEKEIGKVSTELGKVSNKLHNQDFLGKAPSAVVEKVKQKSDTLLEKQGKLQTHLDKIRSLENG